MSDISPKNKRQKRATIYTQAELALTQKPFSQARLDEIFKLSIEFVDRVTSREGGTLEFKETFGWLSVSEYAKTMAAFANTRGGYLVFGIKNSPRIIKGLLNDLFDNIDPQKLTEGLNELFSPELRWEQYIHTIQGKKIGLLYTFPSITKPVIAVKNEGEVKEGEIYYRYAGRTEKIKYPELRQILEDQRRRELDLWLRHLSYIARAGVENVAILDTHNGTVTGASGRNFMVDQDLLPQLKFLREGEFRADSGTPALKLVGNLEAIPEGFIQPVKHIPVPTPLRTVDIIYAFLDQIQVNNPPTYIEQICFETSGFLPVYYYIHLAGWSLAQAIELVEKTASRNPARRKLLERLNLVPSFIVEKDSILLRKVKDRTIDINITPRDIVYILNTLHYLESRDIELPYLAPILKTWFDKYYADINIPNISNALRRAICHLDYALYRDKILMS